MVERGVGLVKKKRRIAFSVFFFNDTATTEIYTLSLHDALPIYPGVGRAVFGKNIMSFEAYSTKALDYWVVAGDTPAEIEEAYAAVAGKVPMMPEYGLGFWQ